MKAVEEGAREWRETQHKLTTRRESMKAYAQRFDPANLLSRIKPDNNTELDSGYRKSAKQFGNYITLVKSSFIFF